MTAESSTAVAAGTGNGIRARLAAAEPNALVRLALRLDAVVTGANGVAYLALAGVLDGPLGIEASTLRPLGAFLVVFAIAVAAVSTRERPATGAVRAVIAANLIWAADSLIVLAAGWLDPSAVGGVWIAMQALVVAGFAGLQAAALRNAARG
jgi:hypothetical protein